MSGNELLVKKNNGLTEFTACLKLEEYRKIQKFNKVSLLIIYGGIEIVLLKRDYLLTPYQQLDLMELLFIISLKRKQLQS